MLRRCWHAVSAEILESTWFRALLGTSWNIMHGCFLTAGAKYTCFVLDAGQDPAHHLTRPIYLPQTIFAP